MASHEVVYGTCENKCRHRVYSMEQANNNFLTKTDASRRYAPTAHTSIDDKYGLATNKLYGHAMVVDDFNGSPSAAFRPGAVALSANAGKRLYELLTELSELLASQTGEINAQITSLTGNVSYLMTAMGLVESILQEHGRRINALEEQLNA